MPEQERKRGGCLTAFLILMLISNPLTGLYYLLAGSTVQQALPSMPGWAIPVVGLLCIANFVFALAIWKWKRWGVYGFGAFTLVAFVINLSVGLPIITALLGLVGIVILVLLLRPVWSYLG